MGDGSFGGNANRQLWYDPTASRRTHCNFPGPQDLCRYGSTGNYFLIMPGVKRIEMTVRKNWEMPKMGDQGKLRFRAEFYNTLNTPGFGAPNNIGYLSNSSVTPDAPRVGEIRNLSCPMRLTQFGMTLCFLRVIGDTGKPPTSACARPPHTHRVTGNVRWLARHSMAPDRPR